MLSRMLLHVSDLFAYCLNCMSALRVCVGCMQQAAYPFALLATALLFGHVNFA